MANDGQTGDFPPTALQLHQADNDIPDTETMLCDEASTSQNHEDLSDRSLGNDVPPKSKITRSSSTSTSSVSSLCDDNTGEANRNIENGNAVGQDGLLKESQHASDHMQIVNQIEVHHKSALSAPEDEIGKGTIGIKKEINIHSVESCSTHQDQPKSPWDASDSNGVCSKNVTRGSEAESGNGAPTGHLRNETEHVLSSDGQTAAVPHASCLVLDETKIMPGANVNTAMNGEGVAANSEETPRDVINNRAPAQNISDNSTEDQVVSQTNDASGSLQMTAPQTASSSGVATSWVSFKEDVVPDSQEPPSQSKQTSGEKEGWVKFEPSPQLPRHPMVPQLTGGSSVHSFDPAGDDRQSDVTMSGSLSESHVSHEYLPLASSPSPQPKPVGSVAGWVKFEDANELPQRQMQSPPLLVPLQASSPSTVQDTASSSASPLSSPGHVASLPQVSRPAAASGIGQPMAGWVSFDEEDSSTPSTPVKSPVSEEKRRQLQQLQQSLAVQQQQQIQTRQYEQLQQQQPQQLQLQQQQQQQPQMQVQQPALIQHHFQQQAQHRVTPPSAQQHVGMTPVANLPSQSLSYPENQQYFQSAPSTSTPLPGNPFREEMLRQQNRAASPFNPFQSAPAQTPSTPGGTVSAMWGESPITPGTVNAMWEKFEESPASPPSGSVSPGNPFKTPGSTSLFNAQPQQITPFQDIPSTPTLKEQAQTFQAKNVHVAEQSSVTSTSSSTPVQSTPVSTQPFQRYTKGAKQVTIRASGKRPKNTHSQPEEVPVDDTPFVDEFPKEKPNLAEGWPLMLRCPDKKKVAGSRYWKPVLVKLLEGNVIQLFDMEHSSEPFRELPLQCNYELGDRKKQSYDTLGKIHTVKLMYVSYIEKRRYGTRTPHEKVINANPLMKLGSTDYNIFRSFISTINEYMMRLSTFRDRGISYKQDAIGVVVSDDYRCRVLLNGDLEKQSMTVDVNVLAFLSGNPECSIALNDIQVKGIEVVSRRDIIPNKTNQWIKLENVELHKCANKNVFVESRMIEFQPLDGCRFCLMKFQTRPRQNAELPLHVKATVSGEGAYLELRTDLLLPARPGRRDPSQFSCYNIMVRIPIPDTWIKYFRRERHLGFHSLKSTHGKPDHIKQGSLNPKLLETSIGTAKYEHAYKSIVWRIDKLPEKATASHILMCHIHLASHREVPRTPQGDVEVEFTMPHTTASKATVRSLAVASDKPSEKRVRYMAHYEYFVEMENKVVLQMLDGDEGLSHCSVQ